MQLTQRQRRDIRAMVKDECANYDYEFDCLPSDRPCFMLNPQADKMCVYFRKGVLPLNPTLEAEIFNVDADKKLCAVCGKMFVPASNRQVYCSSACTDYGNRIKDRELKRKQREKRVENVRI